MWQKILMLCGLVISSSYAADCAKGSHSELQLTRLNEPTVYRLDQSIGQSQFVLLKQGVARFEQIYEGHWFCFGFNQLTKTYLVGGIGQTGAWLPLVAIQYLKEDGTAFITSVFNRLNYMANAAVMSPEGRYIVFIGGQQTTGKLYVLDSQTDTIKYLAKAPAPPPVNSSFSSEEPFDWGTGWADGFVAMEKTVLSFKSEYLLRVSYGKDTAYARAKKRHIGYFKL